MNKYLTVRELDFINPIGSFTLPIALCCGIVKPNGDLIIPEQVRK